MGKFFVFLATTWQLTLTYRAETAVWFILDAAPLVYMISLWKTLEATGQISSQQASQLVVYYLLSTCIFKLIGSHFEDWLIEDIKDGNISKNFLKPFSFKLFLIANEVSWRASNLIFLVPVILLVLPLISISTAIQTNVFQIFMAITILIFSFFQKFFLSLFISTLAFWFQQAKSLVHFKWMLEGTLGGQWLPLFFFPLWFQNIARYTPFYNWYYFPIRLMTVHLELGEILPNLGISVIWLIILIVLSDSVWKKAVKYYSAVGG